MSQEGERWDDWFEPGEKLLWEGAPMPGVSNWPRNLFFTCFGIPFLGGGLATASLGVSYLFKFASWGDPLLGILLTAFSVPFLTCGIAMVMGGWVLDYLAPRRTRYALTDRAGYIASSFWGRKMEVIPIESRTRVELTEARNGTSTIYFHFRETIDSDGDRTTTKKGFESIADGRTVYDLVRQQQRAMQRGTSEEDP